MCNAFNHPSWCNCGFGGDTGGGAGRWGAPQSSFAIPELVSGGWAKESRATVASYVKPNAHCPVCGALVYFYRSPFDGRVFFDDLGWPWPKHPCTDNFSEPRAASYNTARNGGTVAEPTWRSNGWDPLLSSKVNPARGRRLVSGDFRGRFLDLYVVGDAPLDPESPILVRGQAGKPDVFEVTFLCSDRLGTVARRTIAYRARLAPLGDEIVRRVGGDDPVACNKVGQFILWELEDPAGAKPYLERAVAGGIADANFDLAIIEIFADRVREHHGR
jgi:hypothetical protein